MRRRLLTLLATAPIALLAVLLIDRVSHIWQVHWIDCGWHDRSDPNYINWLSIRSFAGIAWFSAGTTLWGDVGIHVGSHPRDPAWRPYPGLFRWLGFHLEQSHSTVGIYSSVLQQSQIAVGIPEWFLAIFCLSAPLLWWRRRRREQCSREGYRCVCGYDLRATPDRCPECGAGVLQSTEQESTGVR
jgi:hypothetical protein